jgi:SPP1 family predicted phage head-tail adaptor
MSFDLTNELTRLHADVANLLPGSAVIQRLTEASDGQGGMAQSWAACGTVACRLVAKSGNTRALGSQNETVGAYTLTVPHDTDIVASDRVVVDSVNYRVLFVDDVKAWKAAIRCDVDLEVE